MTTYRTDWRNIGAWINVRFHPSIGLRTPWGNIIVKRWADRLFSERYSERRSHFWLLGLCVSWVRLRHFANLSEAIVGMEPQPTPLMGMLSKARAIPADEQQDRAVLNKIMGKRVVKRLRREGKIAPVVSQPIPDKRGE